MKLYISADIEGCAGMAAPEEANPDHPGIKYFKEQMTLEVNAACEGEVAAGAKEIFVKDAHLTGRNIDSRKLPKIIKILRGWTDHPFLREVTVRNGMLLVLILVAFPVSAEVFLGEEPRAPANSSDNQVSEAPKVRGKKSGEPVKPSDFGFSASIGAGTGFFSGSGVLTYGFNPYMVWGLSYDYLRLEDSDRFGEEHGPDLAFMLRGPNPTMVTPVVGAGPGYRYWNRSYQDTIFDENQSPVLKYFAGVNIALSRNFGVGIYRQKMEFLRNMPIRYADRLTKEDRSRVDNNIGFYAAF